ncbi:MAG: cytochrome-c oxidase, cbb3-type subunit II [Pseudomonadota bacterium]
MAFKHDVFEKHSLVLTVGILATVAIGGLVEIAPLFYLESTVEKVEGVRPYSPLELKGRDIYIREGCYNCHSQMVRPLRDEVERYGPYSLAAESMYDHPFQWGSKRTGPDLARVGGRYSNDWHVAHMINPRSVVPESIMPGYPHLQEDRLMFDDIQEVMAAHQAVGVPYTAEQIENAKADLVAQSDPNHERAFDIEDIYPKAIVADFDGNPAFVSEMDALIAYLQMLGTLVDFSVYDASENLR